MNRKALFVDDDKKVLATFRRNLNDDFEIFTATSAMQGLEILQSEGPFAVVVSDLKMPEMDGIEFLSRVRKQHRDTVRVILTGYADLDAAIAAVNQDQVFRFLTKPCDNELMMRTLETSIEQYRLVTAERELLQGTLRSSIKVLTDILSLLRPEVYGRVSRIVPYVRKIARDMEDASTWKAETAARLALLGYITLPDKIIKRVDAGRSLCAEEMEIYAQHPQVAAGLVSTIPRMAPIARIITYQEKFYDGSGIPHDEVRKDDIPLEARILKVVLDFDKLVHSTAESKMDALETMRQRHASYDPRVLETLKRILGDEARYRVLNVPVKELREKMILMKDISLSRGGKTVKVLSRGQEITPMAKAYLRKYLDQGYIGKSVQVIEPASEEEQ